MTGRESVVLAGANQLLLIGIKQVVEATDRFEVVRQAHASELAMTLGVVLLRWTVRGQS